ncbi:AAA family ATPase, partial [Amycolatopsis pittospori]|uniref:AAA family ATPase n=1 Tax=Amycolatopsis pittospori TaxID=2749434 RepID=UPI0015F04545
MYLVEREQQLATLSGAFADSLDGRGQVVIVGGAVATGKTSLLRAFTEGLGKATGEDVLVLGASATSATKATPLGLMKDLLRGGGTTPESARLLDEGAVGETLRGHELSPALRGICDSLLGLAADIPLVLTVDDVDHADAASLHCLQYLARRTGTARILLVLGECAAARYGNSAFHAELLGFRHCRRIRLDLLSRRGQAEVLADRLGGSANHRLPLVCHGLTGGNPLLLRSLLEDNPGLTSESTDLVVDGAFGLAVLSCLHRGEPAMSGLARALAIVDESAPPVLLGRLAGLDPDHVTRLLDAMTGSGLLLNGRFRHPALQTVVLGGLTEERAAGLHTRAARLRYDHGAPAPVVARHLVAAPGTDVPWAVPVLMEAAEEALAAGSLQTALACLRRARDTCADERQQARVTGMLARALWRISPAVVRDLLPELTAAAYDGRLDVGQAVASLGYLAWHGQADEAADVFERLASARPVPGLDAAHVLLSCAYPGRFTARARERGGPAATGRLRAATALSAVLTGQPGEDLRATPEQVLQAARLEDTSLSGVIAALATLICDDRLGIAARSCDPLLAEAAARHAPMWHAVLAAVRALICFRQGDLPAAERHARTALTRLSPSGWGVAIGLPISVLVLATTAMGRYEDAATQLGMALPEAMFQTPCGLFYLQARGRYRLATGHPRAALGDLRACGDLVRRWGFDVPGLVTWRSDLARVLVALGEHDEATALADGQLALLRPGPSRSRGISLRARAMTADAGRRLELLEEAAHVQEQGGDQYELSLTLTELSRAQHEAG